MHQLLGTGYWRQCGTTTTTCSQLSSCFQGPLASLVICTLLFMSLFLDSGLRPANVMSHCVQAHKFVTGVAPIAALVRLGTAAAPLAAIPSGAPRGWAAPLLLADLLGTQWLPLKEVRSKVEAYICSCATHDDRPRKAEGLQCSQTH